MKFSAILASALLCCSLAVSAKVFHKRGFEDVLYPDNPARRERCVELSRECAVLRQEGLGLVAAIDERKK